MNTTKQRASRHVTAAMVITDLRSSLVAMCAIEHAGANNPTRDAYALAWEHATAALNGIEVLRGDAGRQSMAGVNEIFRATNRRKTS